MDWVVWMIGAVVLIGFLIGVYRGAVRIAVSIVTAVLTIVITFFATPYVTQIVEEKTPLDDSVKESIISSMEDAMKSMLGIGDEEAEMTELMETVEIPRDVQIQAIETADIPEVFKELLVENNNDEIYSELGVETFAQYVGTYLSHLLIHVATFLALFLLVTIILRALVFALNIVNEIPVFGLLNRIAGGITGAAFSLVTVWFFLVLVTLFYTTSAGKAIYEAVLGNEFTRLIMENNPLLNISIKI